MIIGLMFACGLTAKETSISESNPVVSPPTAAINPAIDDKKENNDANKRQERIDVNPNSSQSNHNLDRRLCENIESECICDEKTCQPAFSYSIDTLSDELKTEMTGTSWRTGCPMDLNELRLIRLLHWNTKQEVVWGELVVAASVAKSLSTVFETAYKVRFPFQSIKRIDHYDGSDDKSMAANNTSAFNCRAIKGTTRYSEHSYGKAIDINPFQNPWVLRQKVDPPLAKKYAVRSWSEPGMLFQDHPVVRAFEQIGWKWGGNWKRTKDYQHFSLSGR